MRKTNETELIRTPVFSVVKKEFEGTDFKPVGINCNHWVMVIAIDQESYEGARAVFVRQTRWGSESKTVEFPCGTVEDSDFAKSTDGRKYAACREFREETGIEISENELVEVGRFNPNPAYFSNSMTVFLYKNERLEELFSKRKKQELDENEDCEVFMDWLANKQIFDNAMQIAGFCCMKEWLSKQKASDDNCSHKF